MLSNWTIEGIDGYRFGEDKKLYKLSFHSHGKTYETREVKKQYPNRYRIDGAWWTEKQLSKKIKPDDNPIELFVNVDLPF